MKIMFGTLMIAVLLALMASFTVICDPGVHNPRDAVTQSVQPAVTLAAPVMEAARSSPVQARLNQRTQLTAADGTIVILYAYTGPRLDAITRLEPRIKAKTRPLGFDGIYARAREKI